VKWVVARGRLLLRRRTFFSRRIGEPLLPQAPIEQLARGGEVVRLAAVGGERLQMILMNCDERIVKYIPQILGGFPRMTAARTACGPVSIQSAVSPISTVPIPDSPEFERSRARSPESR
jgi:hypothetical protein